MKKPFLFWRTSQRNQWRNAFCENPAVSWSANENQDSFATVVPINGGLKGSRALWHFDRDKTNRATLRVVSLFLLVEISRTETERCSLISFNNLRGFSPQGVKNEIQRGSKKFARGASHLDPTRGVFCGRVIMRGNY